MTRAIQFTKYGMWIGGQEAGAAGGGVIRRESPAHDVPVSEYPQAAAADVDRAVAAARKAFAAGAWPNTPGPQRAKVLLETARLIRANAADLALVETLESGKPIAQARDEMEWAAGLWDYAAALARDLRGETYNTLGAATLGLTIREPIGVVGLITPWNFPLLIISQKLPFALAAGCACVVKPSEFTSGTTLRLAKLLQQAGLPAGVVNVVTGYGDPAGVRLCEHEGVDMVSFTGSTRVGRQVVAASAGNLKKVALELGGKNPQVLFPDADLSAAVDAVVFGAFFNMGECCNAGSRLLVHADIADAFVGRVVAAAKTIRVGDPLDESTQVGAIINQAQFDRICGCMDDGRRQGAKVRLGGAPMKTAAGRFVEASVFDAVKPATTLASEEVFGPVLSVLRFRDMDEAVRIVNGTMYGLSASVWTRDLDTAVTMARRIQAGAVWINTFLEGAPELPFGGYRMSGLGRELGRHAAEEYTELKTVHLHLGPRAPAWIKL
jgi:acyl-CoA reductase-like NAD-dependent aldehyde dehydrogenase